MDKTRFLRMKYFSYKVNNTHKSIDRLLDEIRIFLGQGHYIISVIEIMHPEDQGILMFYKHKSELDKKDHEKNNFKPGQLSSYT